MQKTICNLCGNEFDLWDEHGGFGYYGLLGYGSKYDGCMLRLDLCCDCMDKIIEGCTINPLSDPADLDTDD